jgi:hypothetical protein
VGRDDLPLRGDEGPETADLLDPAARGASGRDGLRACAHLSGFMALRRGQARWVADQRGEKVLM